MGNINSKQMKRKEKNKTRKDDKLNSFELTELT